MAMSVICAATVPSGPHHGRCNFDFDQTTHPLWALAGVGQPGAPGGCCLLLTMAWFQNWKQRPPGAFTTWVAQPNEGYQTTNHDQVAVGQAGGWSSALWPTTVTNLLLGRGYTAAGGFQWGPDWFGIATRLPPVLKAARYTFLGYTLNATNHVFGVLRAGPAIYFFDSNEGEVYFKTGEDFAGWFFAYMMHGQPAVARPRLYRLQFNSAA
jgi:hypothetical protein